MKFYTADPHFDHARIIALCNRPFNDVVEMQETIVERWNAKVTDKDDVYILGDFCFGVTASLEFIGKLNGTKHFITGNHDDKAMKKLISLKNDTVKGSPLNRCIFHGDLKSIKDNNTKVVLCHYPIFEWHGSFRGAIHLHGHCHGNIGKSFKKDAWDVGVDVWNFEPVTLEEILND